MAASFSQLEDSRRGCQRQFNPPGSLSRWADPCEPALPLPTLVVSCPRHLSPPPRRNDAHAAPLPLAGPRSSRRRPRAADPVDYRKEIRPVLQERCYACHGALRRRRSSASIAARTCSRRGVIVPGKPAESELHRPRLRRGRRNAHAARGPRRSSRSRSRSSRPGSNRERRSPPTTPGTRPARPLVVPHARAAARSRSETRKPDRRASSPPKWAEKGLTPVQPADKRVLLRRVYLDLIGLPPTADRDRRVPEGRRRPTPTRRWWTACSRRRSTASAGAGTSWTSGATPTGGASGRSSATARSTSGTGATGSSRVAQRRPRLRRDGPPDARRRRTLPDRPRRSSARPATSPGSTSSSTARPGSTRWSSTPARAFLGLTFNCAKCHDHKYDPITQADYYRFRAIFEPYQVRTDLVPGEADVTKDGIPRAFDCNLDAKTPFHIRGDERNPDKDRVVHAGPAAVPRPGRLEDQRR